MAKPTSFIYTDLINGQLKEPSLELNDWLCDGNTGQRLCKQRSTSEQDLEIVMLASKCVNDAGLWRTTPNKERAQLLRAIAKELEGEIEQEMALYDALNTGVVLTITQLINASIKEIFLDTANRLENETINPARILSGVHGRVEVVRKPWGPILILAPWNVPAGSVVPKVAAALCVGAPVILKPSEWAPFSLCLLAKAIHRANLPPGVFQLVNGGAAVGNKLVTDFRIKCVNFTGSASSGRKVMVACAERLKPCMAELGGCNPAVILRDANVEHAAAGIAQAITTLNGQWCCGVGRILVHQELLNPLLNAILKKLADATVGDSFNEATEVGPISNAVNLNTIKEKIDILVKAGGKLHRSSNINDYSPEAFFLPPTVISDCSHSKVLELDEIFGPVASIHPFKTEQEVIEMCNQAPGMLTAFIFSGSKESGIRVASSIEAGMAMVNGVGFGFELDPESGDEDPPVGFWGASGSGEDGHISCLTTFFTGNRVTGLNGEAGEPSTSLRLAPVRLVKGNWRNRYFGRLQLL